MAKYNHAFTIAFEVKDSSYEDAGECALKEKEKVMNALIERLNFLIADESEYKEALECFDTYEEAK